jgi:hypothetical protein
MPSLHCPFSRQKDRGETLVVHVVACVETAGQISHAGDVLARVAGQIAEATGHDKGPIRLRAQAVQLHLDGGGDKAVPGASSDMSLRTFLSRVVVSMPCFACRSTRSSSRAIPRASNDGR